MILYNTLVGVCAGLALILTAQTARVARAAEAEPSTLRGYGLALVVVGVPLTVFSGALALTWPLTANPPVNIAFGEPSVMLGVLATTAGLHLARTAPPSVRVGPALWVVHALGWVLASTASAILSYNLIGDAPAEEPITGQFTGWENAAFGVVYLLAAAGCLAAPWALSKRVAYLITHWAWWVAGCAFLAFSVLNYRTHIGLLLNLARPGEDFRW